MITVSDLIDDDEDGAAARQQFEDLHALAGKTGHELRRTSGGFLLIKGNYSRHTPDLQTIAAMLKQRAGKAG